MLIVSAFVSLDLVHSTAQPITPWSTIHTFTEVHGESLDAKLYTTQLAEDDHRATLSVLRLSSGPLGAVSFVPLVLVAHLERLCHSANSEECSRRA